MVNGSAFIPSSPAKTDPADIILRFRKEESGKFLDDIFAADGSGRVLISDDFFVRKWAFDILNVDSSWLQALIFHLEENGSLSDEEAVEATIKLIEIGEQSLSVSGSRLIVAVKMLKDNVISLPKIKLLFSLVGQRGADLRSHLDVTVLLLSVVWGDIRYVHIRDKVSSLILNALVRHQGENSAKILDALRGMVKNNLFSKYLEVWRVGHFI